MTMLPAGKHLLRNADEARREEEFPRGMTVGQDASQRVDIGCVQLQMSQEREQHGMGYNGKAFDTA